MDNNFLTQITNGTIEAVETGRGGSFVLVSYSDGSNSNCPNCNRDNQTIRLNVTGNTVIMDENSNRIPITDLRRGMTVNAAFSNATTRSIPPQSAAYVIQVIRSAQNDTSVTIGRIVGVDRQNRSFTTVSDGNLSSVIQFNLADNAQLINGFGRPMNISGLMPGLRVRVRHAAFMTASIPPQTTAFEVRVVR